MNCCDTSSEAYMKAELARQETEDLIERALRCPRCRFMVGTAYSDCNSGHLRMKCQKCKYIWTINLGDFCRRRYMRRYRASRGSF